MICVGTDLEMSRRAVALAREYDDIWAAVGVHPNEESIDKDYIKELRVMAADPKVVAIGEVGLDYYRTKEIEKREQQRKNFLLQLQLAFEARKPIIIHCRNDSASSSPSAYREMSELINNWRYKRRVYGVIHSFTGTLDEAEKFLALGYYIGLNGIVTFSEDYDPLVKGLPLERILLETDAPYVTPEPHRGRRNEPSYVRFVAEHIASIKGLPVEEVAHATTENAKRLFKI